MNEVSANSQIQNSVEESPLIHSTLQNLARYDSSKISCIATAGTKSPIAGTKATSHCHFIALDGNLQPRTSDFIARVCEHVIDYSIPRKLIHEAYETYKSTGTTHKITRLHNEARKLFTHLENTGECGEMLLALLAEAYLELPQLIAKMSLKTNSNLHYNGADGVHVGVDDSTGRLALYWSESKIYGDARSATYECLKSLAPYLTNPPSRQRDLELLRTNLDLNDPKIEAALKLYLDPDQALHNQIEFRGLCLIGFDCEHYPNQPNSKNIQILTSEINSAFVEWKKHIGKRVDEEKLTSFVMEIFCFPFPSVEDFRSKFLSELGVRNGV